MTGARWLTREQGKAWVSFLAMSHLVIRSVEERLRDHDDVLTLAEYNLLAVLSLAPAGQLRMGALAAELAVPKTRLTYQVDQFAHRQLIERLPDPDDLRGIVIHITEAGRAMVERTRPEYVAAACDTLIAPLSDEDVVALKRILDKVNAVIAVNGPPSVPPIGQFG